MPSITLRLVPQRLKNPDLDIRYVLPDLLAEKSGGLIEDDGYDYEEGSDAMLVFLKTTNLEEALACISDVIMNTEVLGNDLKDAVEITTDT